jgi:2-polyprenyl-6-hydroxyphenyl methylase/3-demethylubiquinone-9 3-methyltransferase
MSWIHDVVDWVGGYPYEYASVEGITEFYRRDGFEPVRIRENRSYGCHQLVFRRVHCPDFDGRARKPPPA